MRAAVREDESVAVDHLFPRAQTSRGSGRPPSSRRVLWAPSVVLAHDEEAQANASSHVAGGRVTWYATTPSTVYQSFIWRCGSGPSSRSGPSFATVFTRTETSRAVSNSSGAGARMPGS